MLRNERTIRVLGSATDAVDAATQAQLLHPDTILVDMLMHDGLATVRALARGVAEAKVLALAVGEREEDVVACVEAGAAGCVTRDASCQQVVAAMEAIARGEAPCSPLMTAALFKHVRTLAAGRPEGLEERLTRREQEILGLIDEGLSNKEIAQALCIEIATVKNHVHSILEKLHVARRGEAAAAVRQGIGLRTGFTWLIPLTVSHAWDESFRLVLSSPWN